MYSCFEFIQSIFKEETEIHVNVQGLMTEYNTNVKNHLLNNDTHYKKRSFHQIDANNSIAKVRQKTVEFSIEKSKNEPVESYPTQLRTKNLHKSSFTGYQMNNKTKIEYKQPIIEQVPTKDHQEYTKNNQTTINQSNQFIL